MDCDDASPDCCDKTVRDIEIVVVDDGGTPPAADTLRQATDARLRIIRQNNAGPAKARNRGAAEARGSWLAFIDDDCEPYADWLERLLARAADHPEAMIGGATANALRGNLFAEASQQLIDFLYHRLNRDETDAQFLTSNNMLTPAAGFHQIGGFDERFPLAAGEDRQFCRRWVDSGRKIVLERSAIVEHFHGLGLSSYWRQHRNYGRGAFQYHNLESAATTRDQRGGPMVALAITAWPLKHATTTPWLHRFLLSGLLGISQLATAIGYRAERRESSETAPRSNRRGTA